MEHRDAPPRPGGDTYRMNLGILQTPLVIFVVFTVLVFFHELGHFLAAKFFKMKVNEFGFGLPLPGTKRLCRFAFDGETEYTIWPVLFGGFVRIKGMEIEYPDETPKTDAEEEARPGAAVGTTNVHTIRQESAEVDKADDDGFNSRPIYQRFTVILAGPVFSFLLGWLALCSIGFTTGLPTKEKMLVSAYSGPATVAQAAGIKPGEAIVGFDGRRNADAEKVLDTIHDHPGKPLVLTVESKDGQTRAVPVVPKSEKVEGSEKPIGRIGIVPGFPKKRVGVAESFGEGTRMVGLWFTMMGRLVQTGAIKDNVGGPVAIIRETHNAAQSGGTETMALLGQLSLSLGLFNLLPIPVLDGGHLSLMIIEAIRRRKLTADQQGRVLTAGFAILAALFVVIMAKDIIGLFRRG